MRLLRSLGIVKVIRHKARQWNQTNYYTLDGDRLMEWAKSESIEISEMWSTTPQLERTQHFEIVDYIVNKNWEKQLEELDSTGIPVNKTVINLLKMYTSEQVGGAIALIKSRKRTEHIPNPSGYFVAALKQNWASKQIVESSNSEGELDTASIFRHWYDLARELGYCNSQEIRDGEQWVCISGSWEKWADAVGRGYSLEYLKKIMKRNTRQ